MAGVTLNLGALTGLNGSGDKLGKLMELKAQAEAEANKGSSAPDKAKAAAKAFEAYYVQQFMELTMPEQDEDALFSGGFGEEMFRHQLYEKIGEAVAARGTFGLSKTILGQMEARGDFAPTVPAARLNAYAQPVLNGGQ